MGMNHFGEISLLTSIARPNIAIITNIGTSHIGNLGSRENILKAKLEILEGMDKKLLILNNDNDLLHKYNLKNTSIEKYTYGIENESNIIAKNIQLDKYDSNFTCIANGEEFTINVPVGGMHFVYNALCAVTVGIAIGLTTEQIKKGIETFELTKKRMDITELKNGVTIINDSYNASFESMQASLKYLGLLNAKRKIAVLGDMFELGDYAKILHEKVGEEVVKNNIDILICCGENAKSIAETAKNKGMSEKNIYYFESKDTIFNFITENTQKGDVVLFKASNGMKFFEIVDKILINN